MESDAKKTDSRVILCCALCLAIGLWAGGLGGPSPLNPVPNPFAPPRHDRPVLRFLASLARTGLWIMLAAEQPPAQYQAQHIRQRGPNEISHAEGW